MSLGLLTGAALGILALVAVLLFVLTRQLDLGAGPSDETLRNDLIGQNLFWAEDPNPAFSQRDTLTPEKLKSVRIEERRRDTKAGTEQITARLVVSTSQTSFFGDLLGLAGVPQPEPPQITIEGTINVEYRHYDQGWRFEGLPETVFVFHPTAETIATATAAVEATAAAKRVAAAAEQTAEAVAQATADADTLAAGRFSLDSVSMTAPDEGWASGVSPQGGGILLQCRAGQWHIAHNLPYDVPELVSLSMVSAQDGWALGESLQGGRAQLLHYNGTTWERADLPNSVSDSLLFGLHMTGPNDGWLAGWPRLAHYDGTQWSKVEAGLETPDCCINLSSIFMISAAEGWAVGTDARLGGAILHYQAGRWQRVDTPVPGRLHLDTIAMSSAGDGWIFGATWDDNGTPASPVALHYDGTRWQVAASPANVSIQAVSLSSPADGWAVGTGGALLHYQGGTWTPVSSPTAQDLRGIQMTSPTTGWAVGAGVILRYQDGSWRPYAP